ncbi:hypothetical protein [Candidatus Scalindua japonica]|uniref:hypothetical protein n=1 Tax=Candidatus Scalindua japonica TaxID=1284222 RepID=UPI00105689D3|nr:hypothetical protein [Candidatus Scalindua japonica]
MVLYIKQTLDYAGVFLVRTTHPTNFVPGCRMFLVGSAHPTRVPIRAGMIKTGIQTSRVHSMHR